MVQAKKCSNDSPQIAPEYHLIGKCQRSKLNVAAKANYTTLSSCKQFGLGKRALSLNFSPRNANGRRWKTLEYTCEVLQCAETNTGLSLTKDFRYDYYSIFGNPLPTVNSTCVPTTGMFYLITQRMNYTEAEKLCQNKSSVLADVSTEQRTDTLAQLLADEGEDSAYISLKRSNSSDFFTSNGDSLGCTSYRAWAPGHPKRGEKFDCVVITKHRTWRTVPCDESLAALCELKPDKPNRKINLFPHLNN
ncbi:unnamed protein product [Parnassius apollo]|uniref:(apollo) hypothetical protein n=1 Tax=Parnassius apollo TaxID=110799 RepID=A0A8S3Y0K8_PARAO|nr:unnamed protein product [Parnassius apollo]